MLWLLIILVIISGAIAMGAYQVMLNKYYWGPGKSPKDNERTRKQNK